MSKKYYVRLEYDELESKNFISLPSDAIVLIIYIRKIIWNKGNSAKRFRLGFSDIPKGLMPKTNFYRARDELESRKFIEKVKDGGWPNKKTVYAISKIWEITDGELWDDIK